jgi:hypothetical protein
MKGSLSKVVLTREHPQLFNRFSLGFIAIRSALVNNEKPILVWFSDLLL